MNTVVFFLVAVAAVSQAIPHTNLKAEWQNFKTQHAKTYSSGLEENLRMNIFKENQKKIAEHNAKYEKGLVSYKQGINQFADMLPEEFAMKYLGVKITPEMVRNLRNHSTATFLAPSHVELPDSVDWREDGAVTPVKNQGHCGSCWAFSATGSLEGQYFKKAGKLVSLSEQQLVDCSGGYGNNGCWGGLMDQAFEYIKDNKGIDSEESYPYEAEDRKCRFNPRNVSATVTGFVGIKEDDEDDLKAAVATVGPVSVAIYATDSFRFYESGIFYDPSCEYEQLNHGVLAVGYGSEGHDDYWLIKNSWGKSWGDDGYIKMARNKNNNCFIANAASYPTV